MFELFVVFAAFFIKGMSGFADGLIYSSAMSFRHSNAELTPVALLLSTPANIVLAVKERKHLVLKQALPLTLFVLLGQIPGTLFLKAGNQYILKIIMGAVIILIGIEALLRGRKTGQTVKGAENKPLMVFVGVGTGVLCALYGIGIFLTAYVSRTAKNVHELRGNLGFVFAAESLLRIVFYSFAGLITQDVLWHAAGLVPAMLAGFWVGGRVSTHIKEETMRKIVYVLLILMGGSVFVTNFFAVFH
ncbi:MAG: sulfite exporter TauE/SafE family protein [Oscillospiraceae bacterium]|nr:sulfite exporter TauE/SafE family protein [Oscillospiraceae bacterium]